MRYSGYLQKKSSGRVARWQKRYWTLNGTTLTYQNNPKDNESKKSFDLAKVIFIKECTDRSFEIGYGSRVYELRADTHDSMRKWVVNIFSIFEFEKSFACCELSF